VQRWLETGFLPRPVPGQVFGVPEADALAVAFDRLLSAIHSDLQGHAVNMLEGMLLSVTGGATSPEETQGDPLRRLAARMDLDPASPAPFPEWAREIGMSYSHFRARFRKTLGIAPHQYLLKARLERAARLLRQEEGTLENLAFRCGFEDPIHFNKMFRRRYGMPPGRFRQEVRAP
jgi:AraC family transcriptional regulator of arabinose operon